jgi:hypothetical protein
MYDAIWCRNYRDCDTPKVAAVSVLQVVMVVVVVMIWVLLQPKLKLLGVCDLQWQRIKITLEDEALIILMVKKYKSAAHLSSVYKLMKA